MTDTEAHALLGVYASPYTALLQTWGTRCEVWGIFREPHPKVSLESLIMFQCSLGYGNSSELGHLCHVDVANMLKIPLCTKGVNIYMYNYLYLMCYHSGNGTCKGSTSTTYLKFEPVSLPWKGVIFTNAPTQERRHGANILQRVCKLHVLAALVLRALYGLGCLPFGCIGISMIIPG